MIVRSEILKRLYALYLKKKYNFSPYQKNYNPLHPKYKVTALQLEHLTTIIPMNSSDALLYNLNSYIDKIIPRKNLDEIITASNHIADSAKILRILEDRHFKENWTKENYETVIIDTSSYKWQLYFRLAERLQEVAVQNESELAIISSTELGYYNNWALNWYWISSSETAKQNAMEHLTVLEKLCARNGSYFIKNTEPYQRAKNDAHMNEMGNASIASDIYQFLIDEKGTELEAYRLK